MKTWKAWFYMGAARFAIEFSGNYHDVTEAAVVLARKLGAAFHYEVDEVKGGE